MSECKNSKCVICGTDREDLKETPWAHREKFPCDCGECTGVTKGFNGITCKPCEERRREKAVEDYKPKDYSHDHNNDPVCPHCGDTLKDAWDYDHSGDSFDVECGNCGKEYDVEVHTEVTYSTEKRGGVNG